VADAPVAIVGAGPVGLALALGLARLGVRSVLLERRAGLSTTSKAAGVHVRTREALRQWGVEAGFLAEGTLLRTVAPRTVGGGRPIFTLDFTALSDEADAPGLLLLEQARTEALLLDAVRETGLCDVRFDAEAARLEQGDARVRLEYRKRRAGGATRTLDAAWAVGCDGARSFVRDALGLPFDGDTYAVRPLLADVRVCDARDALPWPRIANRADGLTFALRLPGGLWRVVWLERGEPADGGGDVAPGVAEAAAEAVLGAGDVEVAWASRFRIHIRAAPRFRVGRVLLAGDAAHVHSPAGGFGMNAGILDAHNLAWKLAAALGGDDDIDALIDSYDAERRDVVVGHVARYSDLVTRAFIAAPAAFRAVVAVAVRQALRFEGVRRRALRRTAMLDLDYRDVPTPGGHHAAGGAVGLRLPNVRLRAPDGAALRLYDVLPYAPTLIDVADDRPFARVAGTAHVIRVGRGDGRSRRGDARRTRDTGYAEPAGLLRSMLGGRDGTIGVRPDGHVAWTA
jgi:2-polyprenyl-6-methoxyphenol hydroxylase-like FAD-dependent oxidoreductase